MKKTSKILIIGLIIAIMVTYTNISVATSKTDLQNQQSNLNSSISEAQENLNDIKEEKTETLSQVETLMEQISDYQSDIDDLNSEISDLQSKIKAAENQIKEDEEEQKKQKEALDERLVTIYENGEISYLDVLLSSKGGGISDFISSCFLVSELASYDTEMIKQVEEHQKKIEEEKSELENDKNSLDNAKKTKEAKASALKVAKKEKEEKADQLSSEEKAKQKEIEEMLEDKALIEKQLQQLAKQEAERLERERKAQEEAAKKNNSSSSSNSNNNSSNSSISSIGTPSSAGYIFPVQGCSKANIRTLAYPSYAGHTGIDVNIGVTGKNVVAVKAGTVVTSTALKNSNGEYRSYGEYVTINHGDGTVTLYAHMLAGSRKVSPGQKVTQGQVIGTVGSTGNSTGTHLHFEVQVLTISGGTYKFKPVNPIPYLP